MPTVKRVGSYRVVVYPVDHRPEHVHVIGTDGEAVLNLNCPNGPLVERETYGLSAHEVGWIKRQLTPHIRDLCAAWKSIHG